MKDLLRTMVGQPASAVASAVESAALSFQGGSAADDLAVLVVRRPPTAPDGDVPSPIA